MRRFVRLLRWRLNPENFRARTLHVFSIVLFLSPVPAIAEPASNLIDIQSVDPTILVELRYSTPDNITGHAIYPPGTPALVQPQTAARLVKAQAFLRARHFGLKIWDAYRPRAAQMELWRHRPKAAFVANPESAEGSLHARGVAVDVTLVDEQGREARMPTKFDEFTPAARLHYAGENPVVQRNLRLLQAAMRHGGFYGMRTEWWHFVACDWKKYAPIYDAKGGIAKALKG